MSSSGKQAGIIAHLPMHRSLSGSIAAWNGPESKVSEAAIVKGANLCYMGADLDDAVSAWDDCEKNEDYDAWDWKEEVKKFEEMQRRNLYKSPLAWEIDSCDESDSEIDSDEE